MEKSSIKLVRMGQKVKERACFVNCVDYASDYYEELMDLILMKDCKFYIGNPHGIVALPIAYGKRIAVVNMVALGCDSGWEGYPILKEGHLLICKKYYSKKLNRVLTLDEMLPVDYYCCYRGDKYKELGIELIENTAKEILDLGIEMNSRIDGTWKETDIDINLQNRYREIMKKWKRSKSIPDTANLMCDMGSSFLKNNSFLLEDGVGEDILKLL